MAKANPKAWFTSPIAKISYRSVDAWAVRQAKFRPYFATWREAHNWMVRRAQGEVIQFEKRAETYRRQLAKLNAMTDPTGPA